MSQRPEYRLKVVRMLTDLRQKAAMRALAERHEQAARVQRELDNVQRALQHTQERLREAREALSRAGGGSAVEARTLLMMCRDVESLEASVVLRHGEMDRKHREFQKANEEVEKARVALANAARAVQALKQHHARWLAEVTAEEQRNEERELSEHGRMLWLQRQGEGRQPS